MLKSNNIFFVSGLILPAILVFKQFLLPGHISWGDAPFFYPEFLKTFISPPYVWDSWTSNFGGVNNSLWIYPLLFTFGLLNHFFGLTQDLIIRLLFYFPAVSLSLISPILLTKYLGYPRNVQFFSSLLYTFNTYFILLIDGGQLGVALAYGIFPLAVFFLKRISDKLNTFNFFLVIAVETFLFIADARIGILSLLTISSWNILSKVSLKPIILLSLVLIGINSYWMFPVLKLVNTDINSNGSTLQLISLLDTIFLFQPHWPSNQFGQITAPPFYFVGLPLLMFSNLFLTKNKKTLILILLFLIFAFLAKGGTSPFGEWHDFLISNVPFGSAFRDSSKFFTPLLLFGSIIIGSAVIQIVNKFVKKELKYFLLFLVYAYMLFLIYPALLGQLNGVLKSRNHLSDFTNIHNQLINYPGSLRTLWFPEHHPLAFHSSEKNIIDAKNLVNLRPFATMNIGTYDRFNFLQNPQIPEWFDLLGIKYLVFSGDTRKIFIKEEEKKDWADLLKLVSTNSALLKEEWGTTFPIYSVASVKPKIFTVKKLVAVVGGDDIYKRFKSVNENFRISQQGFVFLEDGKFNPTKLLGKDNQSLVLLFNDKENIDLTASLLSNQFISPSQAKSSQWAIRDKSDYLKYKYELLVAGLDVHEFDFQKGIAFSSNKDEEIIFDIKIDKTGEYMLMIRTMSADQTSLEYIFNQEIKAVLPIKVGSFEWTVQPVTLNGGKHTLVIRNKGSVSVLNTLALISKSDWNQAMKQTEQLLNSYQIINAKDLLSDNQLVKVSYQTVNPTYYTVTLPHNPGWLIFTDTYHPGWSGSLPFYSMVNGFYIDGKQEKMELVFYGQKYVNLGIYITLATILSLAIIFVWLYHKENA